MQRLILLLVVAVPLSCGESVTQFSELPDEDPAVVAESPISSPRVTVDALVIDGNVYPVSKFRNVTGLECDQEAVGSKYSNDNQVSKFGGPRGPVESALPVG